MAAGDIAKALRDTVRARMGEPSETGLETVDIYLFLNEAQHNLMWRLHDGAMPEMSGIATGTLTNSRVALPADYLREWLVQIGATDEVAQLWDVSELDALDNNTLTAPAADNVYYFLWKDPTDGALRLNVEMGNPASAAAYDIFYMKIAVDMSDSVDPVLTEDKHDLLVDFAVMRCREQRHEWAEAQRILNGYLHKVNQLNSRYSDGYLHEASAGDVR